MGLGYSSWKDLNGMIIDQYIKFLQYLLPVLQNVDNSNIN